MDLIGRIKIGDVLRRVNRFVLIKNSALGMVWRVKFMLSDTRLALYWRGFSMMWLAGELPTNPSIKTCGSSL